MVAAAVENKLSGKPFVVAMPGSLSGLERSADLQLMGLQSSNTAALNFTQVDVHRDWLLHDDARVFIPSVRPAFIGLQCGMSIGLARRSLDEAQRHLQTDQSVLLEPLHEERAKLEIAVSELKCGLLDGRFIAQPIALFHLRIALADCVAAAVQLELQACGGKAYLSQHSGEFARRWRESAFIPVVSPSLVQLRAELMRKEPKLSV